MTEIPETALRARQMYIEKFAVQEILAATGLKRWKLYFWLNGGPTINGECALPPIPLRKLVKRRRISKARRIALVTRMMRAAERQLGEIEKRLAAPAPEAAEWVRDARLMAVLAKTLRELTALDPHYDEKKVAPARANDNDRTPRNIDEIRRSLSRKLEALVAEQEAELSGGPHA